MGRIIRKVPIRWKHPNKVREDHITGKIEIVPKPMSQDSYKEALKDYKSDLKDWLKGQELWNKGIYWNYYDDTQKPKEEAMKEWLENIEKDMQRYGFTGRYREAEKTKYETGVCNWNDVYEDIPRPPDPDDYMPTGPWIQLFEDVSEGTPLSPPFKTPEQLVEWLTKNKDFWGNQWTKEQAEAMVKAEYSPSFVLSKGKLFNSQEALTELGDAE